MADTTPLRLAVGELWWVNMLKATVAIFFGLVTVFWPGITLVVLIYLLSAFVIVVGIIETIHALMSIKRRNTWWVSLIVGLGVLAVGLYLVHHPSASLSSFILIVGIAFMGWGLLELVQSFVNRLSSGYRVLSLIAGIVSLAVGISVIVQPVSGGLAFVWVLGLFGIIYGIVSLAMGIELRNDYEELSEGKTKK